MTDPIAPEAVPAWLAEHCLAASDAVQEADSLTWPQAQCTVTRAWPGPQFAGDAVAWATPPAHLALVLVRRGGYAVGMADGARLLMHKCGTRYVQSRTAAGGWSQQRFQRRRENQAGGLVEAAAGHAARLLAAVTGEPASGAAERWVDALVLGGDKLLVQELEELPPLAALAARPRRTFFDLPDPDLKTLRRALWRGRALHVTGPPTQ